LSQRGEDAYRRGNLHEALAAYEEARRHYASIDDAKGLATQLLNLGTVHYAIGERDAARRLFEQVLLLGTQVSAATRADAAYRVALIDFDSGNLSSISEWLDRSLALCADAACDAPGRVHNLRARLALARGEVAVAEAEAKRALEYNRRRDARAEQANSLWLLGELAMARGDHVQAEQQYAQALELDRALAEPHKVVRDLLGLAQSLLAQGRRDAAMDYARRARSAAQSSGDVRAVAEADKFLTRTDTQSGSEVSR
jgi:tetratricopeptide (TPR) repeat protein